MFTKSKILIPEIKENCFLMSIYDSKKLRYGYKSYDVHFAAHKNGFLDIIEYYNNCKINRIINFITPKNNNATSMICSFMKDVVKYYDEKFLIFEVNLNEDELNIIKPKKLFVKLYNYDIPYLETTLF